ncbi:hypothetical protein DPMN_044413 [Dreissena polymorpha]|uniref:Uncharacterized protein n=1 Tax=Dreissena polymorpha TaxID=45954 RepID=A0A9D4D2C7_DREPO|nr:hypothetical protein DPMN_044413 [Dreissena polymorpha]
MRIKEVSALLQFICIIGVTVSYDFPSSLIKLCPYSSFCGPNKKTTNVSQGFEPCCRSCSCDADCGLKRNCCFYEDDHYRIEEKGETSCVAPINIKDSSNIQIGRYFMIDKCPGANDTCRSIKAARWGNLFPHLSYNTGVIYYNQFCALCHNELHVVPWTLAVNCHPLIRADTKPFEIEKLLAGQTSKCILTFREPEGIDLASAFCNSEEIQECTDLYPSTEIDTFKKLEEQCHSFNATFARYSFQFRSVFRNVYCFLCSEGLIYKITNLTDICFSHNYDGTGRVYPGTLVTLLRSYVSDYSVSGEKGEEMVCDRIRKVRTKRFLFSNKCLIYTLPKQ